MQLRKCEEPEIYLLGNNKVDRKTWQSFFDGLPDIYKDLHFSIEYLDIYRQTYNAEIFGLYYVKSDIKILQPVVIKRMQNLEFLSQNIAADVVDIESPYGFGGVIANKKLSESEFDEFQLIKHKFVISIGAITEFCSYHPFFSQMQLRTKSKCFDVYARKRCAYIDLTKSYSELWLNIKERQRKAILSARRRGVKVRRMSLNDGEISNFYYSYIATMKRVNASDEWKFPKNYFLNCRDCLGRKACSLFNAYIDDTVIASFFLIHAHDACYYHFSCSDPEFTSLNANHLLMFDTAIWAKNRGCKLYFLGGGYSSCGDDNLYRFKQSFTSSYKVLYQSKEVFDKEKYNELTKMKMAFESAKGNSVLNSQFFPPYRS